MAHNPLIITRSTPAPTWLTHAEGIGLDQRLANKHADMLAQALKPSAHRIAHDRIAMDDSARLPVSQLTGYLLTPETLDSKGKSKIDTAAVEALSETVKRAYEKSPSFRRIFNHARDSRLYQAHERCVIAVGEQRPTSAPTLVLPDVLKRGNKPKYEYANGWQRLSNERAILNAVVKALTQLPEREPEHPRGPNPEYVNIILKEMGIRDPAQVSLREQSDVPPISSSNPSLASLNEMASRFSKTVSGSSKSAELRNRVKHYFDNLVNEQKALIGARRLNQSPLLKSVLLEEIKALELFPKLMLRLFRAVDGSEGPMALMEKLASENARQQIFSYCIDKIRSPFRMVATRDGDCRSFCDLYKMLANAAGIQTVERFDMKGEMPVQLSKSHSEIVGQAPGDKLLMARHSILKLQDDEGIRYFDPVFACRVDPAFYGKDLDNYLRREPGAAE